MRDDAFSPTVPDDEDGYVPAPGDPSGPRPEYEGHPSFSQPDNRVPGEPSLKAGVFGLVEDIEDDEPPVDLPKKNASKDAWVAFGLTLGYTADQLEPYDRDQLAELLTAQATQVPADA